MEEIKLDKMMSEAEFEKALAKNRELFNQAVKKGVLFLRSYHCITKFKSVRRAIKRGHMSVFGDVYPRRPFNNRSTKETKIRQLIYGSIKRTV